METEIIISIIGGIVTIIGALITAKSYGNKKDNQAKTSSNENKDITSAIVKGDKNITIIGDQNSIAVNEEKKSNLSFVSNRVDPSYSLIASASQEEGKEGFAMINLCISNKGYLDAAIRGLIINVKDYIINNEPNFVFFMYTEMGVLYVDALNNGWGSADDYNFKISLFNNNLKNPVPITKIKDHTYLSKSIKKINSNEKINLFKITSDYFDFKKINNKSAFKIFHFDPHFEENKDIRKLVNKPAIEINANVIVEKNGFVIENSVQHDYLIYLFKDSFESFRDARYFKYILSDTIYSSFIDDNTSTKKYNILRSVPSGGIDNFNIYVCSNKSCSFKVIIHLLYNEADIINTDEINIEIKKYTNSNIDYRYIDGCEIATNNFTKDNQVKNIYEYVKK